MLRCIIKDPIKIICIVVVVIIITHVTEEHYKPRAPIGPVRGVSLEN